MKYQILHGDNRDTLKTIADNSIDAIVTDPPYGIDFLGKAWDANTGALETYQECLRVLKPGGHILAFSAARTYHHLAITLEQAGFEIRDQIMWIYSSGFPKSQDIGRSIQRSLGVKQKKTIKGGARPSDKMVTPYAEENEYTQPVLTDPEAQQWEGWGTALKPAHEPIALARKPLKLSIARNCQAHGVGALNIDATRVPYADEADKEFIVNTSKTFEQTGTKWTTTFDAKDETPDSYSVNDQGRFPSNVLGDIPDYQKYFYCPKVSRAERHIGHNAPEPYDRRTERGESGSAGLQGLQKLNGEKRTEGGNNHPTVKPIELMKYLIKLITPPGGVVLDPFNGSGSTGCAAVELGYEYIGCELDENYVEIAQKRIEAWYEHTNPTTYNQIFEQDTK